jgi:hypothetical protein
MASANTKGFTTIPKEVGIVLDDAQVKLNLKAFSVSLTPTIKGSLNKALKAPIWSAKALAPIDTGELKTTIRSKIFSVEPDLIDFAIGSDAKDRYGRNYAIYQEVGFTSKKGRWIPGFWYLTNSWEMHQDEVLGTILLALERQADLINAGSFGSSLLTGAVL